MRFNLRYVICDLRVFDGMEARGAWQNDGGLLKHEERPTSNTEHEPRHPISGRVAGNDEQPTGLTRPKCLPLNVLGRRIRITTPLSAFVRVFFEGV
jgi:hypothetical protein